MNIGMILADNIVRCYNYSHRNRGIKIMKKLIPIILSIILIISVAGNIALYMQLKKVNASNQNLNTTISEMQASITDLENQLSDLQQQLSDSTAKNEELQLENDDLQSELEFQKSIKPMAVTMYALEDCDTYSKPDESSDKVTTVEKSASLHVTGRTSNDWYRVEWGNGVVYIKASLLSDTKSTSNTNTSNSTSTTNNNSNSNSGSNSNSSTTTPSQGSSLTQENVGAILDNLFGEGTGGYGGDLGDQGWSDL